jgi:hypothetical protein
MFRVGGVRSSGGSSATKAIKQWRSLRQGCGWGMVAAVQRWSTGGGRGRLDGCGCGNGLYVTLTRRLGKDNSGACADGRAVRAAIFLALIWARNGCM